MLAIERQAQILSYLRGHDFVDVETLSSMLAVSSMTIRRDLKKLEERGLIRRTHGGAMRAQFVDVQPHIDDKKERCQEEKRLIAESAANLIQDGQTILLDAGTTTMEIAHRITNRKIRVVTPDLALALYLCRFKNIKVIVAGGEVDEMTQSCLGGSVGRFLDNIHVDLAFLGCTAWDLQRGVTSPAEDRMFMKHKLWEVASTRVLVADSNKYGSYSFYRILDLNQFDLVVTDEGLEERYQKELEEAGVSLHVARTDS